MEAALTIIITLVAVVAWGTAVMLVAARWHRRLIEKWLSEQHLAVIQMRRQVLPRGPYKGAPPAGNYGVYRLTVADSAGREYNGWVRVTTSLPWVKPRFESEWDAARPPDIEES